MNVQLPPWLTGYTPLSLILICLTIDCRSVTHGWNAVSEFTHPNVVLPKYILSEYRIDFFACYGPHMYRVYIPNLRHFAGEVGCVPEVWVGLGVGYWVWGVGVGCVGGGGGWWINHLSRHVSPFFCVLDKLICKFDRVENIFFPMKMYMDSNYCYILTTKHFNF